MTEQASERPGQHGYAEIEYRQFKAGRFFRIAMSAAGVLAWPIVLPMALGSRMSETLFRSCAELLSLVPYLPGVIVRYQFYRYALQRCGRNVVVEFGAVFVYPNVKVGSNVLIGRFSVVHHCDIGDYVLIGERCTLLSGSRQHRFERTDLPMALQGGQRKRIAVASDVWIGSHSVVMNDIGGGAVVGAGSVVHRRVEKGHVVGGNPARTIKQRC